MVTVGNMDKGLPKECRAAPWRPGFEITASKDRAIAVAIELKLIFLR
jgi:hypothetical protein